MAEQQQGMDALKQQVTQARAQRLEAGQGAARNAHVRGAQFDRELEALLREKQVKVSKAS